MPCGGTGSPAVAIEHCHNPQRARRHVANQRRLIDGPQPARVQRVALHVERAGVGTVDGVRHIIVLVHD